MQEPPNDRLLSVVRSLGPRTGSALLAWLAERQRSGDRCFAWLEGDRELVGAGSCGSWTADRLDGLKPICSWIAEQPPRDSAELPLAFLAGSFDGRLGSPWEGWPGAELVIPSLVLERAADGTTRAIARTWCKGSNREARDLLERRLDQLALGGELLAPEAPAAERLPLEDPADYEHRVAAALVAIEAGECEKVVLARAVRWTRTCGAFHALSTLARLREAHPDAITFLWSDPRAGAFLGATPEVLARVRGARLLTHALAGTAALDDEGSDLLSRPKDRLEHELTARAIADALAPISQSVSIGAPRLRRLQRLVHLETPITALVRGESSLIDAALRLHPTPAVGGQPRAAAARALATEPLVRGRYAAPLGWIAPGGDGVLAVGLRSALLSGAHAWAFAGAGIVRGSDPSAEWAETELKLGTVERALARPLACPRATPAAEDPQ